MTTNMRIALLIAMMVNAVLFGIGAITVLSVPVFSEHAPYLMPAVIIASILLTPFVAYSMAPQMRSRRWHWHHEALQAAHAHRRRRR